MPVTMQGRSTTASGSAAYEPYTIVTDLVHNDRGSSPKRQIMQIPTMLKAIDWRAVRAGFWRGLRGGTIGLPVGFVMFALLMLASYASLGRDVPTARAHVAQAFATGILQDEDYLKGNTDLGWHQYNDCLILWQAIDQRASVAALTISPISAMPAITTTRCATLRTFVTGGGSSAPSFYHRYIHGHTTLLRFLLPALSVEAIRNLYHTTLTMLVLAGLCVGMVGLVRRRHPAEALFWTIIFLGFSRWFGLETFGQSLGHGPADIILLGYLLFLAIVGTTCGLDRRTALLTAAIFGGFTAGFEFLTGGIPLGMAAVIGGIPFAVHGDRGANPAIFAFDAFAAFCASVLTCLTAKVVLVMAVFGPAAMADSALQLRMRMGFDANRGETHDLGLMLMAKKLAKGLSGIAPGMSVMAGAIIVLAIVAGLWAAWRLLRMADPAMRYRAIALLASNLAIAVMLAMFWQHTMIHAWFMERTLVWPIASGFALFAFACVYASTGGRDGARWAR